MAPAPSGSEKLARKRLVSSLRISGVNADNEALRILSEWVAARAEEAGVTPKSASQEASNACIRVADRTGSLDADGARRALAALSEGRSGDPLPDRVALADPFNEPPWLWDESRRTFYRSQQRPAFLGAPEDKAKLYQQRLSVLAQRTSRHRLFAPPAIAQSGAERGNCELTPIGGLISSAEGGPYFVIAAISGVRGDSCTLEDGTGQIEADLSSAETASGLLTDGCVVLAEGRLSKGNRHRPLFRVTAHGMPPAEAREDTLNAFPGIDLSGTGMANLGQAEFEALQEEESREGGLVVVLSDAWMDTEATHKRLKVLVDGYADAGQEPLAILLLGNFCQSGELSQLREGLCRFGEEFVARAETKLPTTRLIMAPGPRDFNPCDSLPYPPLLDLLREAIREGYGGQPGNLAFACNPVRMRALTHEVVLLRLDLQALARCHCIREPVEEDVNEAPGDEPAETARLRHLGSSLIRQAHLCPLPLDAQPVAWGLDRALSLYPAPHAVALADASELQGQADAEGVTLANPGSFGADGNFSLYRVPEKEFELCQVPLLDNESEEAEKALS